MSYIAGTPGITEEQYNARLAADLPATCVGAYQPGGGGGGGTPWVPPGSPVNPGSPWITNPTNPGTYDPSCSTTSTCCYKVEIWYLYWDLNWLGLLRMYYCSTDFSWTCPNPSGGPCPATPTCLGGPPYFPASGGTINCNHWALWSNHDVLRPARGGARARALMKPTRSFRLGRGVPMWVRCLAMGAAISYLVALGHWGLVAIGALPRPKENSAYLDDGGEWVLNKVEDVAPWGRRGGEMRDYEGLAYGWPLPSWGAICWKRPIPFGYNVHVVAGIDLRPLWRAGTGKEPINAIVPVFPHFLLSIPVVVGWAILCRLGGAGLRWRRRGERALVPCEKCGYDLSGLPGGRPCPECGTAWSPSADSPATPKPRAPGAK